ncbi:MAG: aminopeptidase [Phycisphaerales bacterium]|nr:aminopeptidase [Phycisphaerales bacterium]
MVDPRVKNLADVLVNYSTALKPGEKVLIEAIDVPDNLTCTLIETARAAGADPFVTIKHNEVMRGLLASASEEQMQLTADVEAHRMKEMTAYIGVRGSLNQSELSDVPDDKIKLYQRIWWRPVHGEIRVRKTRWVVLRYPSPSMAQAAGMSTHAFEDFYFEVCTMDYAKMSKAMKPLQQLMAKTDRVRIIGPGTELAFSIKGIPAIGCDGKLNIPDGEVFTAPVRNSVNGVIQYNAPTIYHGVTYENVRLEFIDGKIVKATSSNTKAMNEVFDSDEGARYVGEFAIGFNPHITRPMKDILFDEKIAGSFHFTPGAAYEDEADNGNRSQIHWDLVCMQDAVHGGGEIWFDDKLIRKDGMFVVEELKALNPDRLK